MKGLVAEIALKGTTFAFDKLYTYAVPPELYDKVRSGIRATVPFGKGNITKQGMIFRVLEGEIAGLKKLSTLTDSQPVLTDEMLKMCEYMHETVFCNYYDAVSAMLPTGLGFKAVNYYSYNTEFTGLSLLGETEKELCSFLLKKGETEEGKILAEFSVAADFLDSLVQKEAILRVSDFKRKIGDATQKWVRLNQEQLDIKLTSRQKEVALLLEDIGSASVKEICYFTAVSPSVIENLIKKNVLVSFEKKVYKTAVNTTANASTGEIILTDEQQRAYEGLYGDYKSEKAKTALLYGITGSGKTQVFLKLADKVLEENRGVIVMVPEISLTPQLLSIFTARYGNKVAVFHSAMSMGKRLSEWQRIKDGKALIAIGTRSAIFAPFNDLGLIIID